MQEMKFRAMISWNPKMDLKVIEPIYFTLQELATRETLYNAFSIRELLKPWLEKGNIPDRFTGHKDKKGIDIYEEDIVKDKREKIHIVKWSHELSRYYLKGTDPQHAFIYTDEYLEVIGDAYRNPELVDDKIIYIHGNR